jgi:hypothetical protein
MVSTKVGYHGHLRATVKYLWCKHALLNIYHVHTRVNHWSWAVGGVPLDMDSASLTKMYFYYNLTSLVRHSFIQHPRYYNTFLRDQTF